MTYSIQENLHGLGSTRLSRLNPKEYNITPCWIQQGFLPPPRPLVSLGLRMVTHCVLVGNFCRTLHRHGMASSNPINTSALQLASPWRERYAHIKEAEGFWMHWRNVSGCTLLYLDLY